MKPLVIVESPTKAKTILGFLGKDFKVFASMGHLIDLPKRKMGVNIEENFKPCYVVISNKKKILKELKKEFLNSDKIYLATDPDREGEAIGWHIKNRLGQNKEFLRVIFHEITPTAIKEAFLRPTQIDLNKVFAQQARRILDRIVGYLLSPLLWRKIASGLSAGRVQSVALRLIVEREREIEKFIPKEYWEIEVELKKPKIKGQRLKIKTFPARLEKIDGKKVEIKDKGKADEVVEDLKDKEYKVLNIQEREEKRYPPPPFITSTLQQEAFNKLRFTASKTMVLAQQLYEGIEIEKEKAVGLITYMRTDSVNISESALKEVRQFIEDEFGKDFLPLNPNIYKLKKSAQAAHEAIRPTSVRRRPEDIKEFLSEDQYLLYGLIYKRFIASQMKPAIFSETTVDIEADKYLLRATGIREIFKGFRIIYDTGFSEKILPPLEKGENLELVRILPSQHFTKPPPRFSDSSLIKILEENGIGRPSTYAPILQTIVQRNYVSRQKGYFYPTELGIKVNDLLVNYFSKIVDVEFTAKLEEELDYVEEGKVDWMKVLNDFYFPFKKDLDLAHNSIKKEVVSTDKVCEKCGKQMVIRWAKYGKFLGCSGFPECKNKRPLTTGIKCPNLGCDGELIKRHSKKGIFYGCTNYPECKYITEKLS